MIILTNFNYLAPIIKNEIETLVIEKATLSHCDNIHFEYDIYEVYAECVSSYKKESAGEYTPSRDEYEVKITKLEISTL
jgi:hypothetical protein